MIRQTASPRAELPIFLLAALLLLAGSIVAAPAGLPPTVSHRALVASSSPSAAPTPSSGPAGAAAASLARGQGPAVLGALRCGTPVTASVGRCASVPSNAPGNESWRPIGATPPAGGWLAYDAVDRYAVFLSDVASAWNAPMATWTYENGTWTALNLTTGPTACLGADLAYDSADGYVLYLGGANCSSSDQTWTFSAGGWTRLTLSGPPMRDDLTLIDDPADGYVLDFGGYNYSCGSCNWTWSYSGGTWSNVTPTHGPSPPRTWFNRDAGAFDVQDQEAVLYGDGSGHNETWTWSAGAWTNRTVSTGPPGLTNPEMASDPTLGGTVLFGGGTPYFSGSYNNETWEFVGGAWSQVAPTVSAPPAGPYALAGLPGGPGVLAIGRSGTSYGPTPSLNWEWNGTAWTNRTVPPPPLLAYAAPDLVYDAADGYVLLYGTVEHTFSGGIQDFTSLTWSYHAGVWTNLSPALQPSPRWGASLAYDAADGYVVMFGGTGWPYDAHTCGTHTASFDACGETWEFVGGNWTQLTPTSGPSNRTSAGMAYDAAAGEVVLTGGYNESATGSSTQFFNDTWAFSAGVWTNLTSAGGTAPPTSFGTLTYDSTDGGIVLFGPWPGPQGGLANQTWTFHAGTWTNRTSTATGAPKIWGNLALVDDPADSGVLLVQALSTYQSPTSYSASDWTYLFAHGVWSNLSEPLTPGTASVVLVYDGAESAPLAFGMGPGCWPECEPSASGVNLLWAWETGGPSGLTIGRFTATPAVTDVGVSVSFHAIVSGGLAPYAYAYAGLPAGCTSVNASTLNCTPTASGGTTVELVVTDAGGNRTSATVTVVVHPAPLVSSVVASPSSVGLGSRTLITTNVSGGTSPWSYSYAGLPSGCSSQDVPVLPCTPSSAGNYSIRVSVADERNATASGVGLLTIGAISSASLTLAAFGAGPAALVLGNSTTFTANVSTMAAWVSFGYSGLPTGCHSANTSSLHCTPSAAGTSTVTLYVADASGAHVQANTSLTVYPLGGGHGLELVAFTVPAQPTAVGATVVLAISALGGRGPLSYAYDGLPTGCVSEDVAQLPCTPNASGAYAVRFLVNDSSGDRAAVSSELMVAAQTGSSPLTIRSFVAAPNDPSVGGTTVLTVSAIGGAAPLRYQYFGLPDGCASTNAATLRCAISATGTYPIEVLVTDSAAGSATASVTLWVNVTTAHGSGPSASSGPLLVPLDILALGAVVGGALLGTWAIAYRRSRAPPQR